MIFYIVLGADTGQYFNYRIDHPISLDIRANGTDSFIREVKRRNKAKTNWPKVEFRLKGQYNKTRLRHKVLLRLPMNIKYAIRWQQIRHHLQIDGYSLCIHIVLSVGGYM